MPGPDCRWLSALSRPGCLLGFVVPLPGRGLPGSGVHNTLVRVGQHSGFILASEGTAWSAALRAERAARTEAFAARSAIRATSSEPTAA